MTKKQKKANLEKLRVLFNMPPDELRNDVLWLFGGVASLIYENDDLLISFDVETEPNISAVIVKDILLSGLDVEISECYYFNELGELCWGDRWENSIN